MFINYLVYVRYILGVKDNIGIRYKDFFVCKVYILVEKGEIKLVNWWNK